MKGVQSRERTYSIFARIGKHNCPYCKNLLQVLSKKQIVNSESEEAKDFDFSSMFEGGSLYGNVEFTRDVFYCRFCDIEISINDMRKYEKELKRTNSHVDFDLIKGTKEYRIKWPNFLIVFLMIAVCLLIYLLLNSIR